MIEEPVRPGAPGGTVDSKREPKLSEDLLKKAYRHLVLVRTIDTRMLSLQRQGRIGFYVPSIGEAARPVGSARGLAPPGRAPRRGAAGAGRAGPPRPGRPGRGGTRRGRGAARP